MTQTLTEVLPPALGIALSPFPVLPVILLLFAPRPHAVSRAYLGAWLLGVAVSAAAFTALAGLVELAEEPRTWVSVLRIVVGALLLAVAAKQWLGRGAGKEAPGWMAALSTATPRSAARLGLLLAVANPKVFLLVAAAGLTIGAADLALAGAAGAVVAFTAIASVGVAVPVLVHEVAGTRALRPLGAVKDWLEAHNASLTALVLGVIGVLLLVRGFSAL